LRRFLSVILSVIASVLLLSQAAFAGTSSQPAPVSVKSSGSLGGGSTSTSGGGGSGYVCSEGGLKGAITTSVVNGYLTISYTGVITGNPNSVQSELTAYKDCVTTAHATFNVSCHRLSAHATSASCDVSFSTTPVKWGGQPTSSSYPGWLSQCEASLGSPTITIPEKLKAATISFEPMKWLINLPVEYTYVPPSRSSVESPPTDISGASAPPCNGPTYQHTQLPNKSNGYMYIYRYLTTSASINDVVDNAQYVNRSGVYGNVYPDSPYARQAGYSSTQSLQTVSCDNPTPLVPVSTIPSFNSLSSYTTLFNNAHVCNFDPDTQRILNWVAAIHQIVPTSSTASTVRFVLDQTYNYSVTYHPVGHVYVGCTDFQEYEPPNKPNQWKVISNAPCGSNYSVSFSPRTQLVTASAAVAYSNPVPIDFITVKNVPNYFPKG